MSLFKEKIRIGGFIRLLNLEIIKFESYTYEDFIKVNKDFLKTNNIVTLTKEEFDIFNSENINIRLMILDSLLNDNQIAYKLKLSDREFGEICGGALIRAFMDFGYLIDEAGNLATKYLVEYEKFAEYLDTIENQQIIKNGFVFYSCKYYSIKFNKIYNNNHEKLGVVNELIEKKRDLVKLVFIDIYKKYKLIV